MSADNTAEKKPFVPEKEGDKQFTLYWRDGKRQVVAGQGDTPADAMNRVGYGGGAVRALDFYADGDDDKYQWNDKTKEWDSKVPLVIG